MPLIKPSSCQGCPLFYKGAGFSKPDGAGHKGVLCVAEALGESELEAGVALVGKAGHYLFSQLARVDIERDDFTLFNCVACRPPGNLLAKQSYEKDAIAHCAPNLDRVIFDCRALAASQGQHFTILTLGRTAFKRIMGLDEKDPILKVDYLNYVHWNEKYQAYVVAAHHPSFLMRGNHHLVPTLQFAAKRAIEVAEKGVVFDAPNYLLDPAAPTFAQWVQDYKRAQKINPEGTFLSYDIETPYKVGKDEEEMVKEDNDDYTILRCSFAYKPLEAISVPWNAEYRAILEDLFSTPGFKIGWNNSVYDSVRVRNQMEIGGSEVDGMVAWHVLNSALPKGLGFVTPFYCQSTSMWKHLSADQPAFYNAKDADTALRNFLGIKKDMEQNGLWPVFNAHVVQLNKVLSYMSAKGVKRDEEARTAAETKLAIILDEIEGRMEAAVPQEARKYKVYKKVPKKVEGLIQQEHQVEVNVCSICGMINPLAPHFKKSSARAKKLGKDNLCEDGRKEKKVLPTLLWVKPLPFKISKVGLSGYQAALKHQAILSRRERKVTFDESAIMKLIKKYPKDPLYPVIIEHRGVQKLLSTYIGVTDIGGIVRGGMPIGRDGRIHTLYSQNPNTLRLASQEPNLQNLPRPSKNPDDLCNIIRNLVVASPGCIFGARDFAGIEALLVGYFANSPRYMRLCRLDIHSYYSAYAIHELDGRISANDLPLLSWDDAKLKTRLDEIKKEFKSDRNELYKHLVHGNNFFQGVMGAREKIFSETGIMYPVEKISKVMNLYFELFPEIKKWHNSVMLQAEKDGFLRNPFGYILRFNKVFDYEKVGREWEKRPGPEANKVVAFNPQSTAAGIIKEALLRLWFTRFEEAGQYLRLQVHDELLWEVEKALQPSVDAVVKEEMERPILALPLPASYKMGSHLRIGTDGKEGSPWGKMH